MKHYWSKSDGIPGLNVKDYFSDTATASDLSVLVPKRGYLSHTDLPIVG
jgi:hypothetical protein